MSDTEESLESDNESENDGDHGTLEPVKFTEKRNGNDITAFDIKTVEAGLSELGEVKGPESRASKGDYRSNIIHPYQFSERFEDGDYMAHDVGFLEDGKYLVELDDPDDLYGMNIEGETGHVMISPDKASDMAYKISVHAPESTEAQKYLTERVDHYLNNEPEWPELAEDLQEYQ